ncbi:Bax inhibitor-1/YccA family protein [Sorangium sp. So ce861]|uniref:Bax inhibitor-1/YccA family protein n=1 Tax=Sorangium sp. So ce861 TaxID=3133323 RepID=UPI003F636C64
MDQNYAGYGSRSSVIRAAADSRERFLVRTYNHLFGAIVLFAAIEVALFKTGAASVIARAMMGTSWLVVLGAFMLVSWLASRAAHTAMSKPVQYAALAGYVVAQAIIFVPLLYIADMVAPGAIQSAAMVTMVGFAGLTAIAFVTRKDFSFLGALLRWGGICALVLIGASLLFGFQLGTFFSVAMVAFAGAAILYDTSNVLHHFPEDRHVGAALELFASVAMLFWYVLRLFTSSRD